jgi:aryl-alcohol dehydrogenase-like predicted oxidoreductase
MFISGVRSSLMICSLYGDNEELLGKWFKRTRKRDQIFLATKFGYLLKDFRKFDSSAEYAKKACEKSLETLGVDYIDLCESF